MTETLTNPVFWLLKGIKIKVKKKKRKIQSNWSIFRNYSEPSAFALNKMTQVYN